MDWVVVSLASSALLGLVGVLDKLILTGHLTRMSTFYLFVGVAKVIVGVIIFAAVPWDGVPPAGALAAAIGSGLFWGVGVALVFYGVRVLEVSRAIPVFQTFPVWVAIMAVLFLGEELRPVHWLAIMVVVAGAGLVAVGDNGGGRSRGGARAYLLLVLASLLLAAANVTTKVALGEMAVWNVIAVSDIVVGLTLGVIALPSGVVREVRAVVTNPAALRLLVVTEGVLAPAALIAMRIAVNLGPVSLVSTLLATRPVFVLAFSTLLSTRAWHVLDEPLTRRTLAVKIAAAAMVAAGASALSLV